MVQVLMLEKCHARIAAALSERVPDADVVTWNTDGVLKFRGEVATAGDIEPAVAWASGELLATGKITEYTDVVAALGSVQWLQTAHAGLDHPAYKKMAASGIRFSKSSAQSIPIAEYALAYALDHVQDLGNRRAWQAQSDWKAHQFGELWGATWLIVGYGHIGRNVAKRAKSFDCRTIIVRQSLTRDEFADEVIGLADIHARVPEADFVVLACPATEETRGVVDAAFLSAMKPEALLINVARGSLIDETALLASLDAGIPAKAVLDVFETEPLPKDSELWRHPRVIVTAHTSNAGSGTRGRGDELFLSNLERFMAGEEPSDLVYLR
ncbi:MAG: D-2-hydroxyacid dehydrogenase [Chromatiales bacterium]|jgi:phosphoglycerate dehydrogenase-like enzyme|nr:D-2-hydroxyacid dehydrogenase [Chromatiales bacterium]